MSATHNRRHADRAPITGNLGYSLWRAWYELKRELSAVFQ